MKINMETQYKYGFGTIGQVTRGKVEKKDSIEDLDLNEKQGLIIIPKVIGVYQEDKNFHYNNPVTENLEIASISFKIGIKEEIPLDLICLIHDPTIIKEGLLRNTVKGDSLGRIKYIGHTEELPDFYEKNVPDLTTILSTVLSPSNNNATVLRRTLEHLKLLREDYGLTRVEAIAMEAAKNILEDYEGAPRLVKYPKEIMEKTSYLDLFNRLREEGEGR